MAKSRKQLTSVQKTNRNNRDRGKAFEKRMAEALGWYRVPMSGSSSLFGWCDIRDTETKECGMWLGECKTMTPSNVDNKSYTIELKWLDKLLERSNEEQKMPALFFTLYGDTVKFVAMPALLFNLIDRACPNINPLTFDYRVKRMSKNHKNYTLHRDYFTDHQFRKERREKLNTVVWEFGFEDEIDGSGWVMMHLSDFMKFHNDNRLDLVHKEYVAIS